MDGAESEAIIDPTRYFYVSVKDGGRTGILLGPYETHAEALAKVGRGRDLARAADPFACFYAFGTCSAPKEHVLAALFGKE